MKKILYEFYLLTLLMINMKSADFSSTKAVDNEKLEEAREVEAGGGKKMPGEQGNLSYATRGKHEEQKEKQEVNFTIEMKASVELVLELKTELEKFGSKVGDESAVESLIDYLKDFNETFKERFKRKSKKIWDRTKNFGGNLKDKTAAGLVKIKENPTAAAVVGGLATLGGAYFFREGIAKNIGKVKGLSGKGWNMAKEKGSSAWEYAREIPGKVKGKFKKG